MVQAGKGCKHGTLCVATPEDGRDWVAALSAQSATHGKGNRMRDGDDDICKFVCLKCTQAFPDNHKASKHAVKTKHFVIARVSSNGALAAQCVKCTKQSGDDEPIIVDTLATQVLFRHAKSEPDDAMASENGNSNPVHLPEKRRLRSSTRKTKTRSIFEDENQDGNDEVVGDLGPGLIPLRRKSGGRNENVLERRSKKSVLVKSLPPSNGLRNPNNYCYLNVVLQSLARSGIVYESLVDALQTDHAYEKFQQQVGPILPELLGVLSGLQPGAKQKAIGERWAMLPKIVSSQPVLKALGKHYPRFLATKHEQQDAYEVLCVLLDLAHEQHQKADLVGNGIGNLFEFSVRQVAQCEACQVVQQQHVIKTTSLSLQLCDMKKEVGRIRSQSEVDNLDALLQRPNSDWVDDIAWPVECRQALDGIIDDLERFVEGVPLPSFENADAGLTLDQCLSMFSKVQIPERGENDRLPDPCPVCKAQEGMRVATVVSTFPKVLAIHFSRFAATVKRGMVRLVKLATSIQLESEFDAAQWSRSSTKLSSDNVTGITYVLTSVIVHKGSLERGGHYTVYVRGTDESKEEWFSYSDDSVRQVTREEAMNNQAYIAFYTRVDDEHIVDEAEA